MKVKVWKCMILFYIMLPLFLYGMYYVNNLDTKEHTISTSVACLEDTSGMLTIEQIIAKKNTGDFIENKNGFYTFGSSHSVWWIKLKGQFIDHGKKDYVVSVNNPSVQYITAYIPFKDKKGYDIKRAGWGYTEACNSAAAYYMPAFELPEGFDQNGTIYLRIQSIFPHNYQIRILLENRYNSLSQQNLIFIGIMLGIFITMAMLNSIIYLFFREKVYLYYVIYELSMFAFQFTVVGAGNLFAGRVARMITINQSMFSGFMFMASLLFVKAFLNTRQNAPKHHVALNVLIFIILLSFIPSFAGYRMEANIASDCLGCITAALTMSVSIVSVRKKVNQAGFFLVAWSVLTMGGMVFVLRNSGVLPNCYLVQNFILIAATAEAFLIFTALVDRTRQIWEEKHKALNLYMEAEESRKKAELSFLRAQIKPHFLYNTLSVIAALTVKKPEKAKELLYHLSNYLRGSFHFDNNNGITTLADELETVRAYLTIEKERFREKLEVEYDMDDRADLSITLPLLTIQPLVENAIRHGIFGRPEGGLIRIIIKQESEDLVIRVQDNGVGMGHDKLSRILERESKVEGVGLWNISERLIHHYGRGLEIKSDEDNGTIVTLRIPKNKERNDENNHC